MKFANALEFLKNGKKMALPTWKGYWKLEDGNVMMYCKDGRIINIKDTEDIIYTLTNIASEDWIVLDDDYEINEYIHTMRFGEAIRNIKTGKKVARKGWNGKNMYIYYQEGSTIEPKDARNDTLKSMKNDIVINPHIDMKAADGSIVVGWLASQTDMLAEDWYIVE